MEVAGMLGPAAEFVARARGQTKGDESLSRAVNTTRPEACVGRHALLTCEMQRMCQCVSSQTSIPAVFMAVEVHIEP